ncbi:MAG TPA: hypothetical protein VIH42_04130 [Thermoguttaceae bacterium]
MSTTPYEVKPARLVVFERTGRWAVTLRRELAEAGLHVWEVRSLSDCNELLVNSPASFLILELNESKLEETLRFIKKWRAEFPLFRFAVVADRSLASYQWFMREAGAIHFLCCMHKMGTLAETACRHLARVPQVPQSLSERIWANLPWGKQGVV